MKWYVRWLTCVAGAGVFMLILLLSYSESSVSSSDLDAPSPHPPCSLLRCGEPSAGSAFVRVVKGNRSYSMPDRMFCVRHLEFACRGGWPVIDVWSPIELARVIVGGGIILGSLAWIVWTIETKRS